MTGSSLPTTLVSVTLGHTNCVITSNTATAVDCTLATPLFGGSWKPAVKDAKGLIPVSASLTPATVTPTVTSVSPTTGFNPAGGDIITIVGTDLPSAVVGQTVVSLTFEDGNVCDMQTSTPTQITCKTRGFSPASRRMLTTTFNPVKFTIKFLSDTIP
jgi:hypothetical protein